MKTQNRKKCEIEWNEKPKSVETIDLDFFSLVTASTTRILVEWSVRISLNFTKCTIIVDNLKQKIESEFLQRTLRKTWKCMFRKNNTNTRFFW